MDVFGSMRRSKTVTDVNVTNTATLPYARESSSFKLERFLTLSSGGGANRIG
jgi:hypothetical protein